MLIIEPSRELMHQTFDMVDYFTKHLFRPVPGDPQFALHQRQGQSTQSEMNSKKRNVRVVVSTPDLNHSLKLRKMNLWLC